MRALQPDDVDRVAELVESSLTSAYRLSPQQIEAVVRERFSADPLEEKMDRDDTIIQVTEVEEEMPQPVVAGFVEATLDGEWGEVTWLFVDPEHRGKGLGTALFEEATEQLEAAGATETGARILEANTEGHGFVERFGLERLHEADVEIGGERLTSYVYADPSVDTWPGDTEQEAEPAPDEESFPETESEDGRRTATTDDGQRVVIDTDDELSGTKAPFFIAYEDADDPEQYGHYCSNCGSLDITMGTMERLECERCGNTSASRGSEDYDESYL